MHTERNHTQTAHHTQIQYRTLAKDKEQRVITVSDICKPQTKKALDIIVGTIYTAKKTQKRGGRGRGATHGRTFRENKEWV